MADNWRYILLEPDDDGSMSIIDFDAIDTVGLHLLGLRSDVLRQCSVLRVDKTFEEDGPLQLDLYKERMEAASPIPATASPGDWWEGFRSRQTGAALVPDTSPSHKQGWLARDLKMTEEAEAAAAAAAAIA